MVLVDTSVFLPFLKGVDTPQTARLRDGIAANIPFGICPFVYQELLQGVRTDEQFSKLKTYLDSQRIFNLQRGNESFAEAAKMFYNCRKMGFTIRNSIDLLIAQTAIENDLRLLHDDRDFQQLAKVENRLRFA